MKKIGKPVNCRLTVRDNDNLERVARSQRKTKSDLLREIITRYTRDPAPLSAVFIDRINTALLLREMRPAEEKVQVNTVLPEPMIEALTLLSDQTGVTITALVGLMITGHLRQPENAADNADGTLRNPQGQSHLTFSNTQQ